MGIRSENNRPLLLIATRNKGKIKEFVKHFELLSIDLCTLDDIKDIQEPEETGATFFENASIKAIAAAKYSGIISIADDSGLVVDALDGQPGVYSARFAGENATDRQNNEKLLRLMKDIPAEKRTAQFQSVIAIALPDSRVFSTVGMCEGVILEEPRGEEGFGYDPLFYLPAWDKTFAELTLKEKNLISHRGKALFAATKLLKELLKP